MTVTTLVDVRPGPSGDGEAAVEITPTPSQGEDLGAPSDIVWALASRLVAGLDDRPFHPTAEQLAWVWGGELVLGEAMESRARIAAGRYAGLFTNHVVPDVALDGAPGAYARIWLCARLAFMESVAAGDSGSPGPGDVSAWENEGGRAT
jgi:hypothetical protein